MRALCQPRVPAAHGLVPLGRRLQREHAPDRPTNRPERGPRFPELGRSRSPFDISGVRASEPPRRGDVLSPIAVRTVGTPRTVPGARTLLPRHPGGQGSHPLTRKGGCGMEALAPAQPQGVLQAGQSLVLLLRLPHPRAHQKLGGLLRGPRNGRDQKGPGVWGGSGPSHPAGRPGAVAETSPARWWVRPRCRCQSCPLLPLPWGSLATAITRPPRLPRRERARGWEKPPTGMGPSDRSRL